jgi:hypothetical protein
MDQLTDKYRDGREWTRQFLDTKDGGTGAVQGLSLDSFFPTSVGDGRRISLLKMDVEGAEAVIFSDACAWKKWLPLIDNILIELHDDSIFGNSSEAFLRVVKDQPFDISTHGELTLCKRRIAC